MITHYLDGSEVPPHMRNLRFVPWSLPKLPSIKSLVSRHDVNDPSTWGRKVPKPEGERA